MQNETFGGKEMTDEWKAPKWERRATFMAACCTIFAVLFVWFSMHREQAAVAAATQADLGHYQFDVSPLSARELKRAYDGGFARADAMFRSKRFLIYGRVLHSKESKDVPSLGAWATITAGPADETDLGDSYVQLIASPPWSTVLGNLVTGTYVTANCVVTTMNGDRGEIVVMGEDCNSVSPGLGAPTQPKISPFAR